MKRLLAMLLVLCMAMSCMVLAVSAEENVLTAGSAVTVSQDTTYSFTATETAGYYIYDAADSAGIRVTIDGAFINGASGKVYFNAVAGTTYEIEIYPHGETATIKLQKAVAPTAVAFEKASVTDYVGNTFSLFLTYAPEHTFSPITQVQVGDGSIVNAGIYYDDMIYGEFLSAGTTTITVTTENGKTATATVTAMPLEQLKLNETKTVTAGEGEEHAFSFVPSESGVYAIKSESAEDIYVDIYTDAEEDRYNTYVTIKADAGEAVRISAYPNSAGTFKLTVIKGNQPASIDIEVNAEEIYVGQEFSMNVVSETEYVMLNTVEWTVSDASYFAEDVFPQQYSYIWATPKKAGSFTVTAKAENGKTATKTITVKENPVIKCGEQKQAEGAVVYAFTPTETAEYVIYGETYPSVSLAGNIWVDGLKEVGSKDYRGYAGVLTAGTTYYIYAYDEIIGVDKMAEDPDPYIVGGGALVTGDSCYFRVVGDGFVYSEGYTWTSSDPSVIKLEYDHDGYGECLKEGKTTITAEKNGKKLTLVAEVLSFEEAFNEMYNTNKVTVGGSETMADNAIQDHTVTIEGDADDFMAMVVLLNVGDKIDMDEVMNGKQMILSAEDLSVKRNGSKFSVTIPGKFIQKMGVGEHQLVFLIGDGGATTGLTVIASDHTNPPTGDTAMVMPAVIVMLCAVLGMGTTVYTYRKKQQ